MLFQTAFLSPSIFFREICYSLKIVYFAIFWCGVFTVANALTKGQ